MYDSEVICSTCVYFIFFVYTPMHRDVFNNSVFLLMCASAPKREETEELYGFRRTANKLEQKTLCLCVCRGTCVFRPLMLGELYECLFRVSIRIRSQALDFVQVPIMWTCTYCFAQKLCAWIDYLLICAIHRKCIICSAWIRERIFFIFIPSFNTFLSQKQSGK